MKTPALILTSLLAMASLASAGQTFTYPQQAPIFSITYPEAWEIKAEEATINAGSSDGSVATVLMALEGKDLEEAIKGAMAGIDEQFESMTTDEPQEAQINGMDVLLVNGKGDLKGGGKMNANWAIFTPDKENFFMLLVFTPENVGEDHAKDITSLLQSVKAAEGKEE